MNQIVEKIIRCNINELNNINFPINEKFGLVIRLNGVSYEFIINIKPNSDKLLVLSPNSIPESKSDEYINRPIFDRVLWPFPISTIYFNDPTRTIGDNNLLGGWGIGTSDNWYVKEISEIIKIIANKLFEYDSQENSFKNLIIYGEEMGAFIALQLSILLKNSIVLAEKPRFNVCNIPYWHMLKKVLFNDLDDDEIYKNYSYKLNIFDLIDKEKYVPNSYLILDYGVNTDIKSQYQEFFNKIEEMTFGKNDLSNKFKIMFNYNDHSSNYIELYKLIEKISLLMDVEYNDYQNKFITKYYDYSKVSLKHKSELIKYVTCRVDVKNFGVNNSIEFLKSSDKSVYKIKPNWFNTVEGEGMVFESVVGNLDLEFKCINSGLLKIFLRSKYYNVHTSKTLPIYINYHKMSLNGEDIINNDTIIWHNQPFIFEKNVKDGEIIKLHIEWSPI